MDYQSVSAQTFDQIDTKPTDILQLTTIHDHIHSPIDLPGPSKLGNPPLKDPEFVQDSEESQPPLNMDLDPHTLDQTQEQPQTRVFKTRVSALSCASIYNLPDTFLLFPFHKTDGPQHHDDISGQLDQPYLVDVPTNRQWPTQRPSDLGLCINRCVSFINVEFQEHIAVYQDESGIQLAQSLLARSLVSIHDLLAVAHALQVIFVVGT